MYEISSSKNPIIKEIKSLFKRKNRWENRLFIIEGIKLVEEAIDNEVQIKNILYIEKLLSYKEGETLYNKLSEKGNLIKVSDAVFSEITDTENSQGIIAIGLFEQRSLDYLDKKNQFLMFLDGIQDPGNLGTIIRSADAFNVDGIILGQGCVDAYNPKVVRATMGSIFRVPLYVMNNNDILSSLQANGYELYSTSLEGSVPNYAINYTDNFVIVIGSESKGVRKDILELSHKLIKIPMPGSAESLNAGVAASIIMYEAMKQREKP